MAAGDLVIANGHYEFNGLLFGSNTSFITTKVDGLIGMPSTDSNDIDKLLEHGSIPGLLRIQKRTVAIDLSILGIPFGSIETNLTLAASGASSTVINNRTYNLEAVTKAKASEVVAEFMWAEQIATRD